VAGCVSDSESTSATTEPAAPAQTEATQAETVLTPLLGKQLVNADGSIVFIINANGTMGGTFRGTPIVGTYKLTGDVSCSTYSSPEQLTDREYCSTPAITGNQVIFNRTDGSQSQPYTIQ
jgi:hypothetical protein